MFKILISDSMLDDVVKHAHSKQGFTFDYRPGIAPDELARIIPAYDGLIVRSRTEVTKQVLDAGSKLKAVGRAGVGLDNVDAAHARQKGIEILNTPECSSNSVAEHTVALMFAVLRQISRADAGLKSGRWEKKSFMGSELSGKTLGVIGYGRIGKRVAEKAQSLGMHVIVYDRRHLEDVVDGFRVHRNIGSFLKEVDALSVHVPLNDNTRNLIMLRELKQLKPTSVVINCSRGGIIAERDLIQALKKKIIAGAAVDVFTREPEFNRALVAFPNVVATPHIAASTYEAQERCGLEIVDKMCQLFTFRKEQRHTQGLPHLEIVPTAKIHPHEYFDERRVEPLAKKITHDGIFTNPPLVTRIGAGRAAWYLILDGSNRVQSLKRLKARDALVQIVNYRDPRVLLRKWNHVISGISRKVFLERLRKVPGFVQQSETLERAEAHLREGSWLSFVVFDPEHVYGIRSSKSLAARLAALNAVVGIYHNKVKVARTEADTIDEWSETYRANQIIIVFPAFSKEELIAAARQKIYFPGGITRHLIPQRVLGVNIPLNILKKAMSYDEKNVWLERFLKERARQGTGLRYYEESIFVFD